MCCDNDDDGEDEIDDDDDDTDDVMALMIPLISPLGSHSQVLLFKM